MSVPGSPATSVASLGPHGTSSTKPVLRASILRQGHLISETSDEETDYEPPNTILEEPIYNKNGALPPRRTSSDGTQARVVPKGPTVKFKVDRSSVKDSLIPKTTVEEQPDYGAATGQAARPEDLELEDSFWYLKHRQWSRMYRSSYTNQPKGFFSVRWMLFYLMLYGVYLFLQLYLFHYGSVLEFILLGFISVSLGLWSPTVRWFVRVIAFECYGFFFTFCVMNMYNNPELYVPLGTGIGGLVVLTFVGWLLYPYVLRAASRCAGRVTPKIIAPDNEEPSNQRYEIRQKQFCSEPYSCVYEGQLRKGRPHGMGSWLDTSYQGELLTGYWFKGIPVGPFQSIENDTRNMLVNLRIIYASNGGGRWWLTRTPLTLGVACVEACVSGNFFKGYPLVKMITQPKECECHRNNCTCVGEVFRKKHYRHIDEDRTLGSVSISIDKRLKTISVAGFRARKTRTKEVTIVLKEEGEKLSLGVDEHWLSTSPREGLLFIHGINHDLEDALKRFGQFLALGHFPPHIIPFCFNWPSSAGPLFYWCAQNNSSDTENHRDLRKFLRGIQLSGIRTLHVMCHSMGTRFFLRTFPMLKDLLKKRHWHLDDDSTTAGSSSELDVDPVVEKKKKKHRSMSVNGEEEELLELQNLILLNPDYEVDTFRSDHEELAQYCPAITVYADSRDVALKLAFRLNQKKSLGRNVLPIIDEDGNPLDVDIIDTGDLDSNVNGQFHGYFNINRVMVDDLYDLIVAGKRAEDRTSRLKAQKGQVYRFTMVPSSVMVV